MLQNSLKEKQKELSPSSSPIRRKCKSTANSKGNSSQGRYLTSRKSKSRADEKSSASSKNSMARVSKNAQASELETIRESNNSYLSSVNHNHYNSKKKSPTLEDH